MPTERLIDFHVETRRLGAALLLDCRARSSSPRAIFLQNLYGGSQRFPLGLVGGGHSPNAPSAGAGFSSRSACLLPLPNESALVFQGELFAADDAENEPAPPGYRRLDAQEQRFVIEIALPARQWENGAGRIESGIVSQVRRLRLCIEVTIDPREVQETDDVCICGHGQPALLERTIDLAESFSLIADARRPRRGEDLLAMLRSYTRIGSAEPLAVGAEAKLRA